MKISPIGLEYVTWTVTADIVLDGTLTVHIRQDTGEPDSTSTFVPATWDGPETTSTGQSGDIIHERAFTALVAGREVTPLPAGALQVQRGQNYVWAKIADSPEVIVRPAGRIEGR